MNKLVIVFSGLCLFFFTGVLGAQAIYTQVDYDGHKEPGLSLDLPYKPSVAEGTILEKLEETGYEPETKGALFWKKNTINGFYVYKKVTLPSLGQRTLDLYFKVDPKSRKEKDHSTMQLLVSEGYDNFISPDTDESAFRAARRFLDGFVEKTETYKLEQEISKTKDALAEANDEMKDLKKDEGKIRDDISDLQKDLRKNLEKQAEQQSLIEQHQARLENLRQEMNG